MPATKIKMPDGTWAYMGTGAWPVGFDKIVTFESGNEPDYTNQPDGTLWVEYS